MLTGTNPVSPRPQGVGLSQGQRNNMTGTPKTLVNCAPAQFFAIEYADNEGAMHVTLATKVGGSWYLAPNGENYSKQLQQVLPWLAKQLDEKTSDTDESSPLVVSKDDLDVTGG